MSRTYSINESSFLSSFTYKVYIYMQLVQSLVCSITNTRVFLELLEGNWFIYIRFIKFNHGYYWNP